MLRTIKTPDDIRALSPERLGVLATEIRSALVDTVSRTGGHLGSNLGVVELTIALHRVFRSPRDVIVFDTGHQSYVHKLLTGRHADFAGLRGAGGLSGYPSRAESEHDLVENSHASTALSYADGLAKAFALTNAQERAVVAVVGDGALTGGMCWEALNNIAASHRPVIVVINDNGRSYSPTVGALARTLRGAPERSVFRELGMAHLGPVDGHDIAALEAALRSAREIRAPVVVHCRTKKGRGYSLAEADETDHMHTVPSGPIAPDSVDVLATPSWTQVLSEELIAAAAQRPDLVAITAAMLHPTGLADFARKYPDRVFDVGIAEQHALTCSAGLAMGGLHPVVCVYATFLNRAFDQALMDVALHRLPVTLVLDRAGITGPDGPSHHGMWDLSLLALIPGMRVAAPRDDATLRSLVREALDHRGPTAVRFPKGHVPTAIAPVGRLGRAEMLRDGPRHDVLIVAVGPCATPAVAAADLLLGQGISATVIDPRWVLPVHPRLVAKAGRYRLVVVVEDGCGTGGVGAAWGLALTAAQLNVPVRSLALPRGFLAQGSRSELLSASGLDAAGIVAAVHLGLTAGPVSASESMTPAR